MQRSLKVKLQNAINHVASFADADSPAVFVGGRRRNRKKRRTKNGQNKRKSKRAESEVDPGIVITSIKPDFEYYQDVPLVPRRPLVTCVDLEDPVFVQYPSKLLQGLKDQDRDSVYSSQNSLDSSKFRHDSGCEQELDVDDETDKTTEADTRASLRTWRTHSKDSGVFDDDLGCVLDEVTSDTDSSRRPSLSSLRDGSGISELDDVEDSVGDVDESSAHTLSTEGEVDQFEEIDLSDSDDAFEVPIVEDENVMSISAELAQAVAMETEENSVRADGQADKETDWQAVKIVTNLNTITEPENFLKLTDDDDEIIFDLSQLEINNSDLSKHNWQEQLNKGSLYDPTVLEDEGRLRLPMDLLIDDDANDTVLFDAAHERRDVTNSKTNDVNAAKARASQDPNITCNPLYEQSLRDEEDKVSIKNYQVGFKTNFDNVNFIRIPRSASNKPYKESSPLLKGGSDLNPDEIACCVIL